jgi:hypothetical protein
VSQTENRDQHYASRSSLRLCAPRDEGVASMQLVRREVGRITTEQWPDAVKRRFECLVPYSRRVCTTGNTL